MLAVEVLPQSGAAAHGKADGMERRLEVTKDGRWTIKGGRVSKELRVVCLLSH